MSVRWTKRRGDRERLRWSKEHGGRVGNDLAEEATVAPLLQHQGRDQDDALVLEALRRIEHDEVSLFGLKRLTEDGAKDPRKKVSGSDLSLNKLTAVRIEFAAVLDGETLLTPRDNSSSTAKSSNKSEKRLRQLRAEIVDNHRGEKVRKVLRMSAGARGPRGPNTPIAYAVLSGRYAIVNCLLQAGFGAPFFWAPNPACRRPCSSADDLEDSFGAGAFLRSKLVHDTFAVYILQVLASRIAVFEGDDGEEECGQSRSAPVCAFCETSAEACLLFTCATTRSEDSGEQFFCEACFWRFLVGKKARRRLLKEPKQGAGSSTEERAIEEFLCCPVSGNPLDVLPPADAATATEAPLSAPETVTAGKYTTTESEPIAAASLRRFLFLPEAIASDTFRTRPDYAELKQISNNYTKLTTPLSLLESKRFNVGCSQHDRKKEWFAAVESEDLLRMKALVEHEKCGVDVRAGCNEYGISALYRCCLQGWVGGMRYLLELESAFEGHESAHFANGGLSSCATVLKHGRVFEEREDDMEEEHAAVSRAVLAAAADERSSVTRRIIAFAAPWSGDPSPGAVCAPAPSIVYEEYLRTCRPPAMLSLCEDEPNRRIGETTWWKSPKVDVIRLPFLYFEKPQPPPRQDAPSLQASLGATAFVIDDIFPEGLLDALRFIFSHQEPRPGKSPLCAERRYFCDSEKLVQDWLRYAVREAIPDHVGTVVTYQHMRFLHYANAGGAVAPHTDLSRTDRKGNVSTHTFIIYFDNLGRENEQKLERSVSPTATAETSGGGGAARLLTGRRIPADDEDFRHDRKRNGTVGPQSERFSDFTESTTSDKGGETVLLQTLRQQDQDVARKVDPENGRLFLFPHSCPHEGLPVLKPPKVLLRGEIMLRS